MGLASNLFVLLGDRPLFTFQVAGAAPLRVVNFTGREELSSLFEFRLELAGPEIELATLVGRPGLLQIEGVAGPRHVHGTIAEFEYVGQSRDLQLYEVMLVPWIWRLQHRTTSRIFQDRTTPQILAEVLTQAGLSRDWLRLDLVAEYAPRNYCVQYHESDLAFICRLMEEDGIFYLFDHAADRHVLVLGDHPGAHPPIAGDPVLWFMPASGEMVADREHVQQLRFGERIRPGKVSLRDFNLHHPEQKMDVANVASLHSELEVYGYPGEFQDPSLGAPHQGQSRAKLRLEEHQATRRSGAGASNCPRLTAGHTFTLVGHSRVELDTSYRLLRITHVGHQPQVLDQDASGDSSYRSEFSITELSQPFRPPRRTPRPVMRGLQTATVVGPPGEEVFPDEHARVKVQFHWDRAEPFDETSSCWVRVSQLSAGNGWGTLFLPRIGHEVLIDFIEGDPDRPIIVGRVYTGTNRPPYPLPAQKTRSTIRSESSLGGGGYNELRFEDLKGSEELFLHAQKDWNTVILHDLTERVGVDRSSVIGAAETISVGTNRTVTVGASNTTLVGAGHSVTIVPPPPHPSLPSTATPPIPPTGTKMSNRSFSVTTGLATISIDGAHVKIEAAGTIDIHSVGAMSLHSDAHLQIGGKTIAIAAGDKMSISAKSGLDIASSGGTVNLTGGPMVMINPAGALFSGRVMDLAPAQITKGAATVLVGGPQFPYEVKRLPDGRVQVGENISIEADPARPNFQAETLAAMGIMSTTPSGRALLADIAGSKKNMNIKYFSELNGKTTWNGDGSGSDPSRGADATVLWNPDYQSANPLDPTNQSGSDATLFHEMNHGSHAMNGKADMTETQDAWDNHEERNTINDMYPAENDYLDDRGFPYARPDHRDSTVPMDQRPPPGSQPPEPH